MAPRGAGHVHVATAHFTCLPIYQPLYIVLVYQSRAICPFPANPIFAGKKKARIFIQAGKENHPILQRNSHRLRCATRDDESETVKKLKEKEVIIEEEEMIVMRKSNENCKEICGIVELLECLEKEAITGEDEGKEPTDYNRRAHIFDRSSSVFQALKQNNSSD